MYSNKKWISTVISTVVVILMISSVAPAQRRISTHAQSLLPPDEARDLFNAGQRFFDENRFGEAESKFREVVRRFPKNPITDRADYYLIRTLAQVGKKNEALNRIDGFAKQYPRSRWLADVRELGIRWTNQFPPGAEAFIIRFRAPTPAPPGQAAPAPPLATTEVKIGGPFGPPVPPIPPIPAVHTPFGL